MHFCIVGTGRCGSTLLRNMLDQHPEVFVFPETHWIPKMYEFFGTGRGDVETLLRIVDSTRHVTGKPVTTIDLAQGRKELADLQSPTVREFCDRLGLLLAADAGKTYWADKTPDYGPYMGILQTLWPECKFVHVIRHGAEVALSMANHPGYRWLASAGETWWCPASFSDYYTAVSSEDRPIEEFIDLWRRRLLRIRDESTRLRPGSFMEVRFEDLVAAPQESLRSLSRLLDLPEPDQWISQAAVQVRADRMHSRVSPDVLGRFQEDELGLLADLGYGSDH